MLLRLLSSALLAFSLFYALPWLGVHVSLLHALHLFVAAVYLTAALIRIPYAFGQLPYFVLIAGKAYDWILGEGLWAELRDEGVHVVSYMVGATAGDNYDPEVMAGDAPPAEMEVEDHFQTTAAWDRFWCKKWHQKVKPVPFSGTVFWDRKWHTVPSRSIDFK